MDADADRLDLLTGARQIAEYLGCSQRRSFYLLETGQIPCAKLNGVWIARKSHIRKFIDKLVSDFDKPVVKE